MITKFTVELGVELDDSCDQADVTVVVKPSGVGFQATAVALITALREQMLLVKPEASPEMVADYTRKAMLTACLVNEKQVKERNEAWPYEKL